MEQQQRPWHTMTLIFEQAPVTFRLRFTSGNSILMTWVVLLIGLAAWEICFSQSEALPRSG